jgi:protein-tyrosine phosphatase
MQPLESFTDIHCHLLPGLDDGATSDDEALAMAAMAVADGTRTIIATPHQLGAHAKNSGDDIRRAAARFQRLLDDRLLPLRVMSGADVRIEPDLPAKIRRGEVLTLGDRGRHVLLELPHEIYVPLDRLLAELASNGLTGILSHPERNQGILRQPGVLRPLVERGCLLQVTAGSLTGGFGTQAQRLAASLVEQGLVHFVATDAHGVRSRRAELRPAFERIAALAGKEVAVELCCRNPAMVATGGAVSPHCPHAAPNKAPRGWFRRVFSSGNAAAKPI